MPDLHRVPFDVVEKTLTASLIRLGLSPERARSSIRFSLGASNTAEQVDALIEAVAESVVHLRRISPLTPAHA